MKQTIFITATNTNVGKTYATHKLIHELSARGHRVGVFKPIETGVTDNLPPDAHSSFEIAKLYNPELEALTLEDICPYQFELPAAPYVAKGTEEIEIDILRMALEKIQKYSDIVLIEGAGGLMVPITPGIFMIDLIEIFAQSTLLITPSKLGSINDTLLNIELLKQRGLPYSWTVNLFDDKESFKSVTAPFYKDYFGEFLTLQNDINKTIDSLLN